MDYLCNLCDKTGEYIYKISHLERLTHKEIKRCIRLKHTIKNSNFFDIDTIFHENITNNNQNLKLNHVK